VRKYPHQPTQGCALRADPGLRQFPPFGGRYSLDLAAASHRHGEHAKKNIPHQAPLAATRNHQSAIINHQSAISNHQSAISNHQSAIINQQSATSYPLPATSYPLQSRRLSPATHGKNFFANFSSGQLWHGLEKGHVSSATTDIYGDPCDRGLFCVRQGMDFC